MRLLLQGTLALVGLALVAFVLGRPVVVVPRGEVAPPFALRDEAGRLVSNAASFGRPYLVAFRGRRADGTDALGDAMASLDQALGTERDRFDRLEIALAEPAPEVSGWSRLRGPADPVRALVGGGWGIRYEPGADGRLSVLEERIALVDERGVSRGLYAIARTPPDRIAADARLVLEEADSAGARRLLFATAHLFLCYR